MISTKKEGFMRHTVYFFMYSTIHVHTELINLLMQLLPPSHYGSYCLYVSVHGTYIKKYTVCLMQPSFFVDIIGKIVFVLFKFLLSRCSLDNS